MQRKEQEILYQQQLVTRLQRGHINRRQFLGQLLGAGLSLGGLSVALSSCTTEPPAPSGNTAENAAPTASPRPLTPAFYQWIEDVHPTIPQVNAQFDDVNYQIAPVQGFGIEHFVAEAKNQESTWDVYVGMTPFVEMTQLIEADVIVPWDDYIPADVIDDIIPSIREECTVDGKLYSWPFLLDVICMGWNSALTDCSWRGGHAASNLG